jgi:hypothetical protein
VRNLSATWVLGHALALFACASMKGRPGSKPPQSMGANVRVFAETPVSTQLRFVAVEICSNQRCTRELSLRATLNRIQGEGRLPD